MLQAIFDRKRELGGDAKQTDPFFLLREVAEMSNLKNLSKNDGELTNAQQMSKANYNNLVQANYEKLNPTSEGASINKTATSGYDPLSIEEKIKRLRFAKKDSSIPSATGGKDANWFQKLSSMDKGKEPLNER